MSWFADLVDQLAYSSTSENFENHEEMKRMEKEQKEKLAMLSRLASLFSSLSYTDRGAVNQLTEALLDTTRRAVGSSNPSESDLVGHPCKGKKSSVSTSDRVERARKSWETRRANAAKEARSAAAKKAAKKRGAGKKGKKSEAETSPA